MLQEYLLQILKLSTTEKVISLGKSIVTVPVVQNLKPISKDFSFQLAEGAKVLLTRNIYLDKKLVSGIEGNVHSFLYHNKINKAKLSQRVYFVSFQIA
jgi:hypothetical protein